MEQLPTLKARFRYDGFVRHLENVTLEPLKSTLIGMEVRKGGMFSNKIKRYSFDKIDHPLEFSREGEADE